MDGSFPVHTAKIRSCVEIVFRHSSIFVCYRSTGKYNYRMRLFNMLGRFS
ncbi:hypothetical protein HMPREF1989_01869 [Porphyromonas gingivalis F0566]|nr:hypothetical protein HMPREF1989_01869 [Porphyromonas gingivalis F0566]